MTAELTTRPHRTEGHRLAGALVLFESVLIVVPLIVLGEAIGWPGSLDDPAARTLPNILENEGAVRVGYLVYLAYSALFLPVAVLVTRWVNGGESRHPATAIAFGLAAVSSALRTIGIVRWLAAMFPLAEAWAGADESTRSVLAVQFQSLNDFGGAVGEVLGVSLFAAMWLIATVMGGNIRRSWVSMSAVIAAGFVALPLVELVGIAGGGLLVTIGSTAIHLWLMAVGYRMMQTNGQRVRSV